MIYESKKHDDTAWLKMGLIVLTGIVLTVTVGVIGNLINHARNIERDQTIIRNCREVVKETDNSQSPPIIRYRCGQ